MGPAPELTDEQLRVTEHDSGPLLVKGTAGSGKTTALVQRAARLAPDPDPDPVAPLNGVLVISCSRAAGRRLDDRLAGNTSARAWTAGHLALRLARAHAERLGLDPFIEPLGPGDRLAMLLDHVDELPLRLHEIRGDRVGLLASLLRRIDALKSHGVGPAAFETWARSLQVDGDAPDARREREFAALYARHEELLRDRGAPDGPGLVVEALELVRELGARVTAPEHVIVDDAQEATPAERELICALAARARSVVVAGDARQAVGPWAGGDWDEHVAATLGRAESVGLDSAHHGDRAATSQALGLTAPGPATGDRRPSAGPSRLRFWRCSSELAQAQAVAREVESALAAETPPNAVAVVVPSVAHEGRAVAAALEARSIASDLSGPGAFLLRAEIRDVLAWMRLLVDPRDTAAVARALSRPPVELSPGDLARCTQIARRRKLDMVAGLHAALESPQLDPPARERVATFLRVHEAAAAAFAELPPDVFVGRLIERVGLRHGQLFSASPDSVERLVNLSRLSLLATRWLRRFPDGTANQFARYLGVLADARALIRDDAELAGRPPERPAVLVCEPGALTGLQAELVLVCGLHAEPPGLGPETADVPGELLSGPELPPADRAEQRAVYLAVSRAARAVLSRPETLAGGERADVAPAYAELRAAANGTEDPQTEELFAPGEELQDTFRLLRDEALEQAWKAGGSLSELRLDTYMDVNRAVARHLELLKVAALLQRPSGQGLDEAIASIDGVLEQVASAEQRSVLASSSLDSFLRSADEGGRHRRAAVSSSSEPSLRAFIPRRKDGPGIALSAGDVDLYRVCPLKYKFARVFQLPQAPTINQRFGIVVHQVLERFHAEQTDAPLEAGDQPPGSLPRLLSLFDSGWRRAGFGYDDEELQFRDRAVAALARYHERQRAEEQRPVWLERGFSISVGPHRVRGRVDRVDELPDGGYELIDYKTGRHRTAEQLDNDVQLVLYRMAARDAWGIEADAHSYYYVIDDAKVALDPRPGDTDRVRETVLSVAGSVDEQDFEPTPSYDACSWCEYRVMCPAAEA
ncbi:MAG: PD-(D/E)XK nuclease family protein [Solirubrobacterales bacterium]